ncbi:MAG: ATP-binding protein [bacterium]|nr:ATP-binding protein [bacterium]
MFDDLFKGMEVAIVIGAVTLLVTALFAAGIAVLVHPITLTLGVVTAVTVVAIRLQQNKADTEGRVLALQAYQEKEQERERAALLCDIDLYFPFIHEAFTGHVNNGVATEDAFWRALVDAPATELGTTFHGLPALLPFAERRKHLYTVGKTGSGKTSLLLSLIREDLEMGRGLAVIAPEAELFRDWLLPMVPEERIADLCYFAPGRNDNPLTFNPLVVEPGDDQGRAARELFTIFRQALGEDDVGSRAGPILANAFACLTGRRDTTLWDVRRLLVDSHFRGSVVQNAQDPYVREFWRTTYPSYPKGAHLPILNRLDQFLRPEPIRRSLCHPVSSFSFRENLQSDGILFFDLSQLDPDSRVLLGQLLLSKFQLELMHRERMPEHERTPFHFYADEFQSFAGMALGTWREMLSRGRRYGLALTLAHQHPSQLPRELQDEILGNVASIVAFGLGAKDAQAVGREFLDINPVDLSTHPVSSDTLVSLKVGQAVARLGSGAVAIPLDTAPPGPQPSAARGAAVRAQSWDLHGIPLSDRLPIAIVQETVAADKSTVKTRPAAEVCLGEGIHLGENTHAGKTVAVNLPTEQRTRHVYTIGSSGTGKSTFLLNCIRQGMERGEGLAVLDPHGDLIDHILACVPPAREDDVILIDPADREWPVGFNILRAHSDLEKELLASDLVDVFRRLSTRWGDQMNSVLANAIQAFLESERGGTLTDLRRFLVEPEYREEFLGTVRDEDVRYYWQKEFPLLPGRPQAPLLTRLDTFLRPKLIRNMVSQKESRLDFGEMMDKGKLVLAKLSQGAIGEGNAYLLGSLLVSKFYQLAISRQATKQEDRRPFYLYVDECHNFLTPSMASILSGARKYHLGLILAHQELQQISGKDADVLSAVITNPYTRICFRLGDSDAKKLEKGFAHFDAKDLQSLGVGEAICRVERADFDFNIKTPRMPEINEADADKRRERLVALSRQRYATAREEVERGRGVLRPAAVAKVIPFDVSREEPALQDVQPAPAVPPQPAAAIPPLRTERSEPAEPVAALVTPAGPSPGRGGQRHKYLQSLIKRWGISHGYRATVEKQISDGEGSVDVALEGRERSIAVEISVTSSPNQELEHVRRCLSAGFDHVVAVSDSARNLGRLGELLEREINETERGRVQCLEPDSLFTFLGQLNADNAQAESSVRGYKVSVDYKATEETAARRKQRAISDVVASALKRMKR